jgi:hypothetical protein
MSKRGRAPKTRLKIEALTEGGLVVGWACDDKDAAPATVRIDQGNTLVAESRAMLFRPDLLRAGLSHGHHGFAARLRSALAAGPASFTIRVNGDAPVALRLNVPANASAQPRSVEQLLAPPAAWTAADLLAHPACLPWPQFQLAMGIGRFVDAAFRFVLQRWPSKAEAQVHASALARGAMKAEDLVVKLLRSRERADMPPGLMSPFDAEFLFRGAGSGNVADSPPPAEDSPVISENLIR